MSEPLRETPGPSGPGKMGPFARYFGIFTSPGRVFEHLKARPSWLVILLLVAASIAILNIAFMSTQTGEELARQAVVEQVRGRGVTLSEEQLDQQFMIQKIAAPVVMFIWFPLLSLIITTLVYLAFNILLGGDATFRQVFSITSHVFPIVVLQALLTTGLIFMKNSLTANTSFAVFVPFLEQDNLVYMILRGFDIFFIWAFGLIALGTSKLYGFPGSKCAGVVFGIYGGIAILIGVIRYILS